MHGVVYVHTCFISIFFQSLPLRAYPTGFGSRLHELYQRQLDLPAQRDLRVRVCLDGGLTDRELFSRLPLGDRWDDANMTEVFEYLYKDKHCRTS